jgi:large subunit ribosomal protein L15
MEEDLLAAAPSRVVGLHTLRPAPGSRKKARRLGRGHGSGRGKTAGRGTKGQKSRSGGNINPRFEGGQLPLVQRLPYKRGFVNIFRVEFAVVNLQRLARIEGEEPITPQRMVDHGLVKSLKKPVKVLGSGDWDRKVTVVANAFSASARTKIEEAGGRIEEEDHPALERKKIKAATRAARTAGTTEVAEAPEGPEAAAAAPKAETEDAASGA